MSHSALAELCIPLLQTFLGSTTVFEDARYVIFGAPLDATTSYRSGSRFAPEAVRQASLHMETYSPQTGLDWEDVAVADVGDVKGIDDVEIALNKIEAVVKQIGGAKKVPVMLGGEHTVTLGALRALDPDLVVCMDAHLDLRDELLGRKLSHATFMRRAFEELNSRIVVLGCRALSNEELEFSEDHDDRITVITAFNMLKSGLSKGIEAVRRELSKASTAYLSIDMDVVDPASAPAVGNPSPEGISVTALLDLIAAVADEKIAGIDLTEVAPHYDSGLTAIQAAYILLETIYYLESVR